MHLPKQILAQDSPPKAGSPEAEKKSAPRKRQTQQPSASLRGPSCTSWFKKTMEGLAHSTPICTERFSPFNGGINASHLIG